MAYVVKDIRTGEQRGSGQTRQQVLKLLAQWGVDAKEIPPMPRHGRRLVFQAPALQLFVFIDHV